MTPKAPAYRYAYTPIRTSRRDVRPLVDRRHTPVQISPIAYRTAVRGLGLALDDLAYMGALVVSGLSPVVAAVLVLGGVL